uniref:Uncharacterized protein n=1 Tax=Setaria viridis TaxID=4556 RepID=A0A4U6WEL8_SETVI|nr:hypothetical protein SEVIR_1G257050v2 [Setaria viridis]
MEFLINRSAWCEGETIPPNLTTILAQDHITNHHQETQQPLFR